MVALYVDGTKVDSLAEALPAILGRDKAVELRDDASGRTLGTVTLSPEPICPWEPTLTKEEIDRRVKMGGKPLSEILKRLGTE